MGSCATGTCGRNCCDYPLPIQRGRARGGLGQVPPFVIPPYWPGGGDTDPVLPTEPTACIQENGQPGWSYDDPTSSAELCFPYPGAPGFPESPTAPGSGFPTIPGMPQQPGGTAPFPKLPPGTPTPPVSPPGGGVPGVFVSESECIARESAAANAARTVEEAKVIKYAIITAVVSGVVGLALGKLF